MNTVIENLQTIAPEVAAADVQRDQPLRDQIDLDSMDFLNFIISLHKTLGVDIPEADYSKLITLNNIVAYLKARVSD